MRLVILIDDDRDDAELFREALSEVDAAAVFQHFEESRKAVEALSGKRIVPQFIFLDINMPVLSGWQCLALFKQDEQLKNIPVIMYTTSSQAREIELAQELGADGFITKPADYTTLKQLLAAVLVNDCV